MTKSVTKHGNQIELLSLELLDLDNKVTQEVYREKVARNKNIGWHYMLDLVWTMIKIRDLPAGSWILDAGAGNGLLQYLLIKNGYRVISVDFTKRIGPRDINWVAISNGEIYDNEYLQHLKDNYAAENTSLDNEILLRSKMELDEYLGNNLCDLIFYRSDLSDMNLLSDGSVDAVVSISAIEHNDLNTAKNIVYECLRVLKQSGRMMITTSASETGSWYHKPSKGWCYSEEALKELFQFKEQPESNYQSFKSLMEAMSTPGNVLHEQLASFYFESGNNGMPWGKWLPKYLPVGIVKIKDNF